MPERSNYPKARMAAALLIVASAGACVNNAASRPNDAPGVANTSVMWEDGARASDTGEAMLTKGEKRLELGRRQVRDGESKIREGTERVEKARLDYEHAVTAGSLGSDTKEQARALRAIGLRWETAIQQIKDGNKLVAKGNANIDRGESEIREGRRLMETGSILMRNAHRSRLGQPLLPMPKS